MTDTTGDGVNPAGIFSFDINPEYKNIQVVANNYNESDNIVFDTSFSGSYYIIINEYQNNNGYTWRRDRECAGGGLFCIGSKGPWHTASRYLNINQTMDNWELTGSVPTDKSSIADTGVSYLLLYRIWDKNSPQSVPLEAETVCLQLNS